MHVVAVTEGVVTRPLQGVAALQLRPATGRIVGAPHLVAPADVHDAESARVGRRRPVGTRRGHPVHERLRLRLLRRVAEVDHPVDGAAFLVLGDRVLVAGARDADDRLAVGVEEQLPQHHRPGPRHRVAGGHPLVLDGRVEHRGIRPLGRQNGGGLFRGGHRAHHGGQGHRDRRQQGKDASHPWHPARGIRGSRACRAGCRSRNGHDGVRSAAWERRIPDGRLHRTLAVGSAPPTT